MRAHYTESYTELTLALNIKFHHSRLLVFQVFSWSKHYGIYRNKIVAFGAEDNLKKLGMCLILNSRELVLGPK